MTVLTIIAEVCKNGGVSVPAVAVANTAPEIINMVQFSQEAANEITRRVDWGELRATATITATGTNDNFALPSGFQRLIRGNAVTVGGVPVRGGLSPDEWASLTPTQATPRYFRLVGDAISFYPFPAVATDPVVSYQSKFWCSNGTAAWSSDDNTALIPEDLIAKGTIWRWKRHMRQDYDDYLSEFEAALNDYADFDARKRA